MIQVILSPNFPYFLAFKAFDLNGDGFITPEELKTVLNKQNASLNDDQVNAFLKAADTNGDGKIDYPEFLKLMSSL